MEQKVLEEITTIVSESLARIEKETKNFAKIEVFNTAEDLESFLTKNGCERSDTNYPIELIVDLTYNTEKKSTKFIIAGFCLAPMESTYFDARTAIDISDDERSTFHKLYCGTKISNKFSMAHKILYLENKNILFLYCYKIYLSSF